MTEINISNLADEIINGRRLRRGENLSFFINAELSELCSAADRIRQALCGNKVNLCSIINGKSGKCSENCKFCAQSAHHCTGIEEYSFLDYQTILNECKHNESQGVHRFSIVTAGRTLSTEDFEKAVSAYEGLYEETDMRLCASHGFLTDEQFERLFKAGVRTYHCNIETSKRNFPNICTTHTYDEKIANIKRAQKNGLMVCSGGIIGMGETWEDRIDMAVSLSELGVVSIPINALNPIKGTPLEDTEKLTSDDIIRTVAIFRFINPEIHIRLAAGRNMMSEQGADAFKSGANSAITGDMLTTSGNTIKRDVEMLTDMGFDLSKEQKI